MCTTTADIKGQPYGSTSMPIQFFGPCVSKHCIVKPIAWGSKLSQFSNFALFRLLVWVAPDHRSLLPIHPADLHNFHSFGSRCGLQSIITSHSAVANHNRSSLHAAQQQLNLCALNEARQPAATERICKGVGSRAPSVWCSTRLHFMVRPTSKHQTGAQLNYS